jgi:hypothetical protein
MFSEFYQNQNQHVLRIRQLATLAAPSRRGYQRARGERTAVDHHTIFKIAW